MSRTDEPYTLQLVSTSVGYGVFGGKYVTEEWLVGLQATEAAQYQKTTEPYARANRKPCCQESLKQEATVALLLARWHVLDNPFFLQGGAAYRRQEHIAEYDHGWLGEVQVTWSSFAANAGVGGQWLLDSGLTLGAGYSVLFSEEPKLRHRMIEPQYVFDPDEQAYIDKKMRQERNRLDDYARWPVFMASLGWSF
jgi:hypothetical protein